MDNLKIIKDDPSFIGSYKKDEDAFNHEAFAQTIFRVLEDNEPPLTIGLFGGWGVGKTSIINLIEQKCGGKRDEFAFVMFNAWAYSGDSLRRQLLLAVAKGIIRDEARKTVELDKLQKLNYAQVLEDTPGESLKSIWDKVRGPLGFWRTAKSEAISAFERVKLAEQGVVGILVSLIFFLFGILLFTYGHIRGDGEIQRWSLLWFVFSAANLFVPKVENIFVLKRREILDARLIFPEQFEEEYNRLLGEHAIGVKKVVIVIDDLDRCDAETIKSVLVTLKNFMGKGKSIFIIPMDDSSVVQMFKGQNTNFGYEQLRKYFTVSLRIPPFYNEDVLAFARKISGEYNIPPSVVYIAAVGYCKDARKIKHFLNMFKIKYALAEERAQSGYLGDLRLDTVADQLAKLVVLEYQFQEFFQFISANPESINIFSHAARDLKPEGLGKILWKELGKECSNIDDLWRDNPGLRQFLRATDTVPLDHFDLLSKLKTSNQEYQLAEFGTSLRKYVTQGLDFDLDKYLTVQYVASHGRE